MVRWKLAWMGAVIACGLVPSAPAAERFVMSPGEVKSFRLPRGVKIEKVAGPPLIQYPLFACFDDAGRLYVAEGTGTNLPGTELVPRKLGKITRLTDTDGDGQFDESVTFADKLVFPQGVLWHDGSVYCASHPSLWKLTDTDGDGQADVREEFLTHFNFNGNGCDLHGPFLGPDGWMYWTDGRHGYDITTREGVHLQGLAARIWRSRFDGTGVERICGGGFDNPVELVFTETGEMVGTMDQGTGDALLHYVEGGVYPRGDHPCLSEFKLTGPLLPPLTGFSAALPAALCGLVAIRTDHFGPEFPDTLLTTQFNVHRVQQHALTPQGGTLACVSKDFLVSANYDLRLTDILEDADGSLLLVDMGAWYNYGCPTAKIAKPEVKGAIYRLRREGAPKIEDPWGRRTDLRPLPPEKLTAWLGDPRPLFRDRVIAELARRGAPAVEAVALAYRRFAFDDKANPQRAVLVRRQAVWTLCRMRLPAARAIIREALSDPDATVRMVAAHCVALERDGEALEKLARMVIEDEPRLRRRAAAALGRMGRPAAVAVLIESMRKGPIDRYLEHAICHAIMEIDNREAVLPALGDANPLIRRVALIALDQMDHGQLTRDQVAPLLDTDDPDLQQAALAVISRHDGWADQIRALVDQWLTTSELSANQEQALTGALLALSANSGIQELIARSLTQPSTPVSQRRLLLRVIGRARVEQLPDAWSAALQSILQGADPVLQREAVMVARARNLVQFDAVLKELSARTERPAELRIAALECLASRQRRLSHSEFDLLQAHLSEKSDPLLRVAAARTLGGFRPEDPQLLKLAEAVAQSGPLTLPLLIPAFSESSDAVVGRALLQALLKSAGADSLSPDEVHNLLKRFPADVQETARPLLARLADREREQEAYLTDLVDRTLQSPGNPERGRDVFFSQKVGCYGCHKLEGKGGSVGPDLSLVGRFRDPRALLEAIVFPSSTIVPEFRSLTIATRDGKTHTGMIVSDTSDALFLRTGQLAEIRIPRKEVEDIAPSAVSIMPQGLEKTMTDQEFADLLEFLYQRR
ncbi:MAG: HEAT repeat domain-containing protein [Planctomycetes bacterium]|nr:HEAT repeat domain-containing protein [Planctomycetota bacterium]